MLYIRGRGSSGSVLRTGPEPLVILGIEPSRPRRNVDVGWGRLERSWGGARRIEDRATPSTPYRCRVTHCAADLSAWRRTHLQRSARISRAVEHVDYSEAWCT